MTRIDMKTEVATKTSIVPNTVYQSLDFNRVKKTKNMSSQDYGRTKHGSAINNLQVNQSLNGVSYKANEDRKLWEMITANELQRNKQRTF